MSQFHGEYHSAGSRTVETNWCRSRERRLAFVLEARSRVPSPRMVPFSMFRLPLSTLLCGCVESVPTTTFGPKLHRRVRAVPDTIETEPFFFFSSQRHSVRSLITALTQCPPPSRFWRRKFQSRSASGRLHWRTLCNGSGAEKFNRDVSLATPLGGHANSPRGVS